MKIYLYKDKEGNLISFEIDNWNLTRKKVTRILKKIPEVTVLREPKLFLSWFREEAFCEFSINGIVFTISEPFGDNSRYLISNKNSGWNKELEIVKRAFQTD